MSTIKCNNAQIGQSPTATNNFVLYQPASPDGTVRLGNGNAGSVTDLVTLTSAGNLGIGTSSPLAKTNVVSTGAALGGTAQLAIGSGTNNYENTYLRIDNSGNSNFCIDQIVGGTSLNRLFIERTTGNVGIGTSSPAQKLHLSAAGNLFAQFSDTTNSVTAYAGIYNGVQWIGTSTSHPITFNTANTERMRLDTSGNLGLGVTPSGTSKFEVYTGGGAFNAITARFNATNSPICFGIANSNGFPYLGFNTVQINGTDNQTYSINTFASRLDASSGGFRFFTAPSGTAGNTISFTQAMTLDASGNLLVGTTSQILAGSKLSISGSGSAGQGPISLVNTSQSTRKWYCGPDSNGSFVVFNDALTGAYLAYGGTTWLANVSDARLKNKIDDIKDAVSAISKLNPLTFYLKNEPNEGTPRYGFFAQNVGEAIPDAMIVSSIQDENIGELYTYDPSIINVYLVKAIQELSQEIETLKQKVNA